MKKIVYLLGYLSANLALAIPVINDISADIYVDSKEGLVKIGAGKNLNINIPATFNITIDEKKYRFKFPAKDSAFTHVDHVTIYRFSSASAPLADYSGKGKPGSPDYDNVKGELQD